MREETKLIRAIQWKKIIDEQLASGLTQTAWCQVNNISRNTFKNWKSRLTEYTLQELNTKATELGIPVSGISEAGHAPLPSDTSSFAELSADIVEPAISNGSRQCFSGSPIDISCGRFTIHLNTDTINEQALSTVLKVVAHAD